MQLTPEEYLAELADKKLEEVILRDGGIVQDKFKAEALCEISLNAACVSHELFKCRDKASLPARNKARTLVFLTAIAQWASALYASYGHELMVMDEIQDYADELDDDLQHDGILACFYIQSAVKDLSDSMFAEDEPVEDEIAQPVAEILALVCALSTRVGATFEDVVTSSY